MIGPAPGALQRVAGRAGPRAQLRDGRGAQQRPGDGRQHRLRTARRVHGDRRHDQHRLAPGGHDEGQRAHAVHRRHHPRTHAAATRRAWSWSASSRSAGASAACPVWTIAEPAERDDRGRGPRRRHVDGRRSAEPARRRAANQLRARARSCGASPPARRSQASATCSSADRLGVHADPRRRPPPRPASGRPRA